MHFKNPSSIPPWLGKRVFLFILIIQCFLEANAFQKPEDLIDPADTTSAIDLTEVPLGIELFRRAALAIQDAGFEKQFSQEFQNLREEINKSLSGPGLGCLLKVRVSVNPEGAIAIPGGQLIAFEGIGRNPIDALANLRMTGGIAAPEWTAPPFEDQSYYIWIKREQGKLKGGFIPREWKVAFEKQAQEESLRRGRLAKVEQAAAPAEPAVEKAKYWNELAQTRVSSIHNNAERQRVKELVRDFTTAQRRFNEAYEQYLQREQELRDEQQNVSTLQTILRITGIVSSAVQLGQVVSAENKKATVTILSGGKTSAARIMIEYHEKRVDNLRGDVREWGDKLEIRGATLNQLNENLVKAFQDSGANIPEFDRNLALPPR